MDWMCVGTKRNQLAACGKALRRPVYITFTRVLGVLNQYCMLYNHSWWGLSYSQGVVQEGTAVLPSVGLDVHVAAANAIKGALSLEAFPAPVPAPASG